MLMSEKIAYWWKSENSDQKWCYVNVCIVLSSTSFAYYKEGVTIVADFGPEINPPFLWRSKRKRKRSSKHQTKSHCGYQWLGLFLVSKHVKQKYIYKVIH